MPHPRPPSPGGDYHVGVPIACHIGSIRSATPGVTTASPASDPRQQAEGS